MNPALRPALPTLVAALALGCAPAGTPIVTECPLDFSGEGNVRVLAVGHRVTLEDARSFQAFEESFRRHLPALLACRANDKPTLITFPEDSGLVAWFLGDDALLARQASSAETAFNLLYAGNWRAADAWRTAHPELSAARGLTLAASPKAIDAMERVFSRLAKDTGAWVVTSANVPRYRPGEGAPLTTELYNAALVYAPDGSLHARTDKVYLTDTEEKTLDLSNAALTDLDVVTLPFGKLALPISRDAFYPTFTQRMDDLGAELVVQPEAFSGWTQEQQPGDWLPEVLLASSWSTTLKYASTRFSAMPVLTGNILDVVFDGQLAFTGQPVPGERAEAFVGLEPLPGLLVAGPWTHADDGEGTVEERRARLRTLGAELLPGRARAGRTIDSLAGLDLHLVGDGARPERPTAEARSVELSPAGQGHQRNPVVARDEAGTVYVAWSDTRTGVEQVWLSRSLDDGATWTPATHVAEGGRQLRPALAAGAPGHVVVAWQELGERVEQLRVAEARDGQTFTARFAEPTGAAQWEPAVTLAGGTAVVAWTDFREGLASFIRVQCGAQPSFVADDEAKALTRANASQAQPALVALGATQVALAFLDYRDRSWSVRARTGALCDGTGPSLPVSPPSDREVLGADVQLAVGPGGELTAAWDEIRDRRGRREVAAARFLDGAWKAWAPPARSPLPRVRPSPVYVDGAWRLVLQEVRDGKNALTVLDEGATSSRRLDESGAAGNQLWQPRALVTPSGLLVVFTDDRSGFLRVRAQRGLPP